MLTQRLRVEIHDEHGEAVLHLPGQQVPDAAWSALGQVVDEIPPELRDAVMVRLVRQIADEAGYARTCERRGLLL